MTGVQTRCEDTNAHSPHWRELQRPDGEDEDRRHRGLRHRRASANENGTTYMNAWINAHKRYATNAGWGTSLSSAQKKTWKDGSEAGRVHRSAEECVDYAYTVKGSSAARSTIW
jgi:hypothetical protein